MKTRLALGIGRDRRLIEVKDLAEPLLRLAGDAGMRARMSARGRELADERFDIAKNRERYAEIYDALARR